MTAVQKLIVFLNNFGTGLFSPVLSLFLLSHGCGLESLSIALGVYSATTIVAEVPSGMFADMKGRKNCYFLSCALSAASFAIMYLSRGFPLLIVGMVLLGLGGAFQSGSLDSLIIEECARREGDGELSKITGTNLVCQCAGISLGALAGGILPDGGGYLPHIIVRLSILIIAAVLSAAFLKEAAAPERSRKTAFEQARTVVTEMKGKKSLRIVMLCVFGISITLFAVETYWQPFFSALIPQSRRYMLGVLCAMGYGGNMLGSFLISRVKMTEDEKRWQIYLIFAALMGLAAGALALQKTAGGFMICYTLAMTALGIANVPEQTLINSQATNETRASLISLSSLFSKTAGVFNMAISALVISSTGISGVWALSGGATLLAAVLAAAIKRFYKSSLKSARI